MKEAVQADNSYNYSWANGYLVLYSHLLSLRKSVNLEFDQTSNSKIGSIHHQYHIHCLLFAPTQCIKAL